MNTAPGAVFAMLYVLHNLQMEPISLSVALHKAGRLASNKHSSLLGSFISYKEKNVVNMAPGAVFTMLYFLLN